MKNCKQTASAVILVLRFFKNHEAKSGIIRKNASFKTFAYTFHHIKIGSFEPIFLIVLLFISHVFRYSITLFSLFKLYVSLYAYSPQSNGKINNAL